MSRRFRYPSTAGPAVRKFWSARFRRVHRVGSPSSSTHASHCLRSTLHDADAIFTSSSSAARTVRATCQLGCMESNIGRNCLPQSSSLLISKCQMVGARSTRGLPALVSDKLTGFRGTWAKSKHFSGWSLSE